MSWKSGGILMDDIIAELKGGAVPLEAKKRVYSILIQAFEDMDYDVLCDCKGQDPAFDAAFDEINPPEPEDDQ